MTDVVHVPYKGAGPGIADLVSGHIPMMSPNITGQLLEFHKTGKIRILAINSPAAAQGRAGHPDRHRAGRAGHGRAAVPRHLRAGRDAETRRSMRISAANRKAVDNPEFEKVLIASGFEIVSYFTADSARKYMAEEFDALEAAGRQHRAEDQLIRTRSDKSAQIEFVLRMSALSSHRANTKQNQHRRSAYTANGRVFTVRITRVTGRSLYSATWTACRTLLVVVHVPRDHSHLVVPLADRSRTPRPRPSPTRRWGRRFPPASGPSRTSTLTRSPPERSGSSRRRSG